MATFPAAPLPGFRNPPPKLRALAPDGDEGAEPHHADAPAPSLPRVVPVTRKSDILRPGRSGAGENVATLNLTLGCTHRCTYCFARAYANYPGDHAVFL